MSEQNVEGYLGIQLGTVLQIQSKGTKGYGLSSLVGKERGVYLIVHTPAIPNFFMKLNKERQVIVRYIHEGVVYGFQCTLIHFIEKPVRLSFLSYPENIETINLRTHERVSCFLPASASVKNAVYEGVVLDLSISGCSFYHMPEDIDSFPRIENEEAVTLSLQLMGGMDECSVTAVVKNSRRDNRKVMIGSEFRDMSPEIKEEIKKYIQKISDFRETD